KGWSERSGRGGRIQRRAAFMSTRPDNDEADVALANARAAWQRRDAGEALTHCRNALALAPDAAGALTLLGVILRTRDPHAAQTALRRALEIDAGNVDAAFHTGNPEREQGNYAAGIKA